MKLFACLLALFLLPAACAPVSTIPSTQPASAPMVVPPPSTSENLASSSAASLKADWPNAAWTQELAQAISELGGSLPAPAGCDRIQYFVMLMSSLARYESGFKPATTYTEAFPDANGVRVVSRGLFQLSIESANGARYKCGIKKAEELHDPVVNIRCAVKVANALVKENGVVTGGTSGAWKGMARYWSPFRKTDKRDTILAKAKASCK